MSMLSRRAFSAALASLAWPLAGCSDAVPGGAKGGSAASAASPASAAAGRAYEPLDLPAVQSPLAAAGRMTALAAVGSRLIAAGPRGHVLASDDAGTTWTQQPVPVRSDLVALQFPTEREGWLVGHDGVVLHTVDGGRTWQRVLETQAVTALLAEHLRAREAAGDADVAAQRDELARAVADPSDKSFLDVHFVSAEEGFAVGAFNLALWTRDGGRTWRPLGERTDNPHSLHLYALARHDGTVWVAGEQGLLRRWQPAQQRFVAVPTPYNGSYFGLLAGPGWLIAYGMRGNAWRTRDGGHHWQRLDTGSTDGINACTLTADGRIVLVTQGGQMLVSADGGERFAAVSLRQGVPCFAVAACGGDRVAIAGPAGLRTERLP